MTHHVERQRTFTLAACRGLFIDLLGGFCGPSNSSLASMPRLPSNAVIAVRKPPVSLIGGEVSVYALTGALRGEGECDEGI